MDNSSFVTNRMIEFERREAVVNKLKRALLIKEGDQERVDRIIKHVEEVLEKNKGVTYIGVG